MMELWHCHRINNVFIARAGENSHKISVTVFPTSTGRVKLLALSRGPTGCFTPFRGDTFTPAATAAIRYDRVATTLSAGMTGVLSKEIGDFWREAAAAPFKGQSVTVGFPPVCSRVPRTNTFLRYCCRSSTNTTNRVSRHDGSRHIMTCSDGKHTGQHHLKVEGNIFNCQACCRDGIFFDIELMSSRRDDVNCSNWRCEKESSSLCYEDHSSSNTFCVAYRGLNTRYCLPNDTTRQLMERLYSKRRSTGCACNLKCAGSQICCFCFLRNKGICNSSCCDFHFFCIYCCLVRRLIGQRSVCPPLDTMRGAQACAWVSQCGTVQSAASVHAYRKSYSTTQSATSEHLPTKRRCCFCHNSTSDPTHRKSCNESVLYRKSSRSCSNTVTADSYIFHNMRDGPAPLLASRGRDSSRRCLFSNGNSSSTHVIVANSFSKRSDAKHTQIYRRDIHSSRDSYSNVYSSGSNNDTFEAYREQRPYHVRLPSAGLLRSPDPHVKPLQVVLVGRPNVGKSTLYNRLLSGTRPATNNRRRLRGRFNAGSGINSFAALDVSHSRLRRERLLQQAIISAQAGTTRDRRIARVVFGGLQLLLVDTGGLEDKETTDASQLLTNMRKQVRVALRDADCVLFVVDAKEGITPVDVLLARLVKEWLEEEEQQKRQQLLQYHVKSSKNSIDSQNPPAPDTVVMTVRATEKRAGGRRGMQQHQSGGRRLLIVSGNPEVTCTTSRATTTTTAAAPVMSQTNGSGNETEKELTTRAICRPALDGAARWAAGKLRPSGHCYHESAGRTLLDDGTPRSYSNTASDDTTLEDKTDMHDVLEDHLEKNTTVPVILVANKADGCFLGTYLSDCYELDLGSPIILSAKKNEGFDDLYDRLVLEIGHRQEALETVCQPACYGDTETIKQMSSSSSTTTTTTGGAIALQCNEEVAAPSIEEGGGKKGRQDEVSDNVEVEANALPANGRGRQNVHDEDNKYICERVKGAPQPSKEADSWLEGLRRRYGKCGASEFYYSHLCNPASSAHDLPWDLSRTSIAAAAKSLDNGQSTFVPASDDDGGSIEERANGLWQSNTTGATPTQKNAEKIATATAEWQRASKGVLLPVEEECVSLRMRRSKLKTKEGRDRLLSLKRQILFDETVYLAVIGRPNVGKSTLVNALLQQDRMIVSDQPGTTTDSIATEWEYKNHPFCLIDTSGVTRGWKMKHTDLLLEAGMQTLRNIRRAQVCILCIDGSAAESSAVPVSSHELSLAHLATSKEGRCLVVCITKWDLVSEQQREKVRKELLERLQTGLGHVKGCPVVFTAAKHGHNLDTLMNRVLLLYRRWNARIPTSRLNAWLQQFMLRFPPPWRLGSRCQIKYVTQVKGRPPTIVAWSNVYSAFPVNYLRQLQNAMREEFSLGGTPIRFIMRTTANLPTNRKKLSRKELLKWRRQTPKSRRPSTKLSKEVLKETSRSNSLDTTAAD